MDPKVREILSKARVSAVNYGKAAGKYAGNVVEQAKINLQIFDLNTEIEVAYKEIGKLVYAVHAGEEVCNEAVQAQIEKIDSKTAQIAELRARLSGIKEEKADVAEEICVCDDVESCVEPATPECEEKNGCCCDGEAEEVKSEECCCAEAPAEDAPCCCGEEEKPAEKCCCSDAPNA
ncbi:MAG: hypothetical protein IKM07_07150 [Clostridia bacterium]|nr:hypothetical protein [Clostridia bacterium]